ncbi:hypothetical protein A5320_09650 [Rheinheimera sp. SA_1]|jgi:hypothetical protein|uniref:hypothetical protein n=1 Tax=Rheinheimera sp. SA_1 TaxID=1827365 RepID=UPI000802184A|nr:hypothetical protein [Rheinheimera sp. SA_1]OBP15576.1 hypothetical protein A5320_09650 [Rheinheimera sp. SA_1]
MSTQPELDTLMQQCAADAVQFAAEEYQINLDFSLESLLLVDSLLSRLHEVNRLQRFSDEHMFTLCNIFAAYVGQIFINVVGGEWIHQKADETAPYVSLNYNNREFPLASLCYHKISKDHNLSVRDYISKAMSNVMQ